MTGPPRPWPRFFIPRVLPRGRVRYMMLVAVLTLLAGLFNLLVTDIDEFEARTGFFDFVGTMIIDGIVALTGLFSAFYAVSLFFPRSWGEKSGIGGALVAALVALFCFSVLWHGGV